MKKEIIVYYAVGGSGQGCIFTDKPERDGKRHIWLGQSFGAINFFVAFMESEGLELPPITWKDKPVELHITIEVVR